MTHEELLAKIDNVGHAVEYGHGIETSRIVKQLLALCAVVELHKPVTIELCDDEDCCGCGDPDFICSECQSNDYPCPTIQAIEKELR